MLLATEVRKLFRGSESNQLFRVQRPNLSAVPHMKYHDMVSTYKRVRPRNLNPVQTTSLNVTRHGRFELCASRVSLVHGSGVVISRSCLLFMLFSVCNMYCLIKKTDSVG